MRCAPTFFHPFVRRVGPLSLSSSYGRPISLSLSLYFSLFLRHTHTHRERETSSLSFFRRVPSLEKGSCCWCRLDHYPLSRSHPLYLYLHLSLPLLPRPSVTNHPRSLSRFPSHALSSSPFFPPVRATPLSGYPAIVIFRPRTDAQRKPRYVAA